MYFVYFFDFLQLLKQQKVLVSVKTKLFNFVKSRNNYSVPIAPCRFEEFSSGYILFCWKKITAIFLKNRKAACYNII